MSSDPSVKRATRLAHQFSIVGGVLAVVALGLFFVAMLLPINIDTKLVGIAGRTRIRPLPVSDQDVQQLIEKTAGTRLIKASQVIAAVKDSGAAAQLLKKLRLQGVVQIGGDLAAYIQVEKQGTKTVRTGEAVLDFVVDRIEGGRVTLSLEGVAVTLEH